MAGESGLLASPAQGREVGNRPGGGEAAKDSNGEKVRRCCALNVNNGLHVVCQCSNDQT